MPAVVAFHGYTAYAWQLEETSGLSDLADEAGFVVAYPQALGEPTDWGFAGHSHTDPAFDGNDLPMVEALLDVFAESGCVDTERVVIAGHSMGGGMASDTARRLADRVACAALVAATWFELPGEPVRPVPVVSTHATDDEILPYAGSDTYGTLGRPPVLPVETAIGAWAAWDGCSATPMASPQPDGTVVLEWQDCDAPVTLYRLPSGGHDWPSLASDLIVQAALAGG
jgi:polyhydroxybutyrate depolymerase